MSGATFPAFAGTGSDFLNQSGPALPAGRRGSIWFDDTRNILIFGKLPSPMASTISSSLT